MELKNNFFSVVCLGCFNPAILTPEFLKKKCGFETDSKPKGTTTPIGTSIEYENIVFLLELERFLIKHSNIGNFLDTPIVNVMLNYLTVLEYTPLQAIGLNLNYNVTSVNIANFRQAIKENEELLFRLMELTEITTTYSKHHKETGESELIEFNIAGQIDKNIIERLNLIIKDNIQINYNHEIRNLQENRELLKMVEPNWKSLVKRDEVFRKVLFKEEK